MKFGIVGVGNQGTKYAKMLVSGEIIGATLSAVCDTNPEKLASLSDRIGGGEAKLYSTADELIGSGTCDAVIVTTPHYFHTEIVKKCFEHGLAVLCDKPLGVYKKEVSELCSLADECGVLFGIMFNQRTNCIYRKMREIISEGALGAPQRVNWIITDWYRTDAYYKSGEWRASWAGEGGGVLINQAPHQIDLLTWIVGSMPKCVRSVCGYGHWHDIEVEDEASAFFMYENGATGILVTSTAEAPGTNRLEIVGSLGKLVAEDGRLLWYKNKADALENSHTSTSGYRKPEVEVIEVVLDGKDPEHAGILQNFTNAYLGLEELFVDGREGIKSVEFMNAMELSGWRGGEAVHLPIDEDVYLDELDKRRSISRYTNK